MPRNKTRDTSYRWNTRLAGALHSQLSYFEVLTRNAMNNALQDWNDKEKGSMSDASFWYRCSGDSVLSCSG